MIDEKTERLLYLYGNQLLCQLSLQANSFSCLSFGAIYLLLRVVTVPHFIYFYHLVDISFLLLLFSTPAFPFFAPP